MQVDNVRLGFATNSSSSHSIVIVDGDFADRDAGGEYGWDNFVLTSPDSKLHYLAVALRDCLEGSGMPKDIAKLCILEWLGVSDVRDNDYIDHQSQLNLPNRFGHTSTDPEFVRDFAEYLSRDDIVIFGGNDNCDYDDDFEDDPDGNPGIPVDTGGDFVCRKEGDKHWTIFNRVNGARITVNFGTPGTTPEGPLMPMLADLKITDRCYKNCPYCYQDSGPCGEHAKSFDVLKNLAELKVFEVAIGGGEPTIAPHFVGILQQCRELGIVPNFSTGNLDWINNNPNYGKIIDLVGGFAVSCSTPEEVREAITTLQYHKIPLNKASIQHIIGGGTYCRWNFQNILRNCADAHVRLTLLGFKTAGRGASFLQAHPSRAQEKWLETVQEARDERRCPRIGIDTVLAAKYERELEEAGISDLLYHTNEDRSIYIDLVSRQIGPSSYCPKENMLPLASWQSPESFKDKILQIRAQS